MKPLPFALALALLTVWTAFAQDQPEEGPRPLLSRQQRLEVRRFYDEASELFRKRQFELAGQKLDQLQVIFPEHVDAMNMRGAIFLEQHDTGRAAAMFDKALEVNPSSFWPKFNKAEILFQQHKYNESKSAFEGLTDRYPYTEHVQFKLILNELMLKDEEVARAILSRMKYPSGTGAYHYAWAAIEFSRGKQEEAKSWMETADALFGTERNTFFYDSLADLGWVEKRTPQ